MIGFFTVGLLSMVPFMISITHPADDVPIRNKIPKFLDELCPNQTNGTSHDECLKVCTCDNGCEVDVQGCFINPSNNTPSNPINTMPSNTSNTMPSNPSNTMPSSPSNTMSSNPCDNTSSNPSNTMPSHPSNTMPSNPSNTMPSSVMRRRDRQHSECLHTSISIASSSNKVRVSPSFYMVTSAEMTAVTSSEMTAVTSNTSIPCGDVNVTTWGSMHPVFSRNLGKIFKNKICADMYNVTDGELWDAYFSCNSHFVNPNFMKALNRDSKLPDAECFIEFKYNGDVALIRSEHCYHFEDYKSHCSTFMHFRVPSAISASEQEVIDACESSLLLPYMRGNVKYANVFCYICSGGSVNYNCEEATDISLLQAKKGIFGKNGLTMMLGWEFFYSEDDDEARRVPDVEIACPTGLGNKSVVSCRKITCPSGQISYGGMDCFFPVNKWMIENIGVNILLTPTQIIDVPPLSMLNLKSPFGTGWRVNHMFYDHENMSNRTQSIKLVLIKKFKLPILPSPFLKFLQVSFNKPWFLYLNETDKIRLDSELVSFCQLSLDDKVTCDQRINHEPIPIMYITKLYFCEQVLLTESEFTMYEAYGHQYIVNNITNQIISYGEYSIVENEGSVAAMVCLKDSGFARVPTSHSPTPLWREWSFVTYILLLRNVFDILTTGRMDMW